MVMNKKFLEEIGVDNEETIDKILEANCYDVHEVELEIEKLREIKPFILHCKPCANFQTIEFDYFVSADLHELPELFDLYAMLQSGLQKIGAEQVAAKANVSVTPYEAPSEKQKALMEKLGIKYTSRTTKKDAQKLIKDTMEAMR